MKKINKKRVQYEPFTQTDFDAINKIYGKKMSIIDMLYNMMSPALRADIDKAMEEYIKYLLETEYDDKR